jgi:hypothetical protein
MNAKHAPISPSKIEELRGNFTDFQIPLQDIVSGYMTKELGRHERQKQLETDYIY